MSEILHSVFMIGRNAICPACSGMAILEEERERIKCIDCGETFKINGIGQTEREIICTKSA